MLNYENVEQVISVIDTEKNIICSLEFKFHGIDSNSCKNELIKSTLNCPACQIWHIEPKF